MINLQLNINNTFDMHFFGINTRTARIRIIPKTANG